MKPTMELRFVERVVPIRDGLGKTVRILQQKWEGVVYDDADYSKVYGKPATEWRDVPVEKELKL